MIRWSPCNTFFKLPFISTFPAVIRHVKYLLWWAFCLQMWPWKRQLKYQPVQNGLFKTRFTKLLCKITNCNSIMLETCVYLSNKNYALSTCFFKSPVCLRYLWTTKIDHFYNKRSNFASRGIVWRNKNEIKNGQF